MCLAPKDESPPWSVCAPKVKISLPIRVLLATLRYKAPATTKTITITSKSPAPPDG
jgi:hypothetical protein